MPGRLTAPVRIAPAPVRLAEGESLCFEVVIDGIEVPAFAVRWRGGVHAFVNRCRHLGLPLDFGDGRFFDDDFDALVCCHHGARYHPGDGTCLAGPCAGARLTPLRVEERPDGLWCTEAGAP